MFGRESKTTTRIDILLGKSARIHGDVEFAGGLHVEGRVMGNVRSDGDEPSTLSVSEDGYIEGHVVVNNVVLNGTVNGDIHATGRVVLGAQAKVQGNVYYGVIETALGAQITGRLISAPPAPAAAVVPVPETKSAT
jgi:cytoskeletal protein CcmA (bactofilin family)